MTTLSPRSSLEDRLSPQEEPDNENLCQGIRNALDDFGEGVKRVLIPGKLLYDTYASKETRYKPSAYMSAAIGDAAKVGAYWGIYSLASYFLNHTF